MNTITVTIPNPTPAQLAALSAILDPRQEATNPPVTGRTRKSKPLPTVDEEESEDFGTKEMTEEELDETEHSEEEEEEDGLTFDQVKAAINKYGEKNPDGMKAILLTFNVKTTKELSQHEKKWEPVYNKVMAKLKALKRG